MTGVFELHPVILACSEGALPLLPGNSPGFNLED
jgi:hypothetical protein